MPVTPTYPGVYIQEVSSGVRTITGVATSITAFIGRASRGPVNQPVTINNYGDYERVFGGLQADCLMSYAVRDFFLNGGGQGIIVRLYSNPTTSLSSVGVEAIEAAGVAVKKIFNAAATEAGKTSGGGSPAPTLSTIKRKASDKAEDEREAAQQNEQNASKELQKAKLQLELAKLNNTDTTSLANEVKQKNELAEKEKKKLLAITAAIVKAIEVVSGMSSVADFTVANFAESQAGSITGNLSAKAKSKALLKVGDFKFDAASEGAWGNSLEMSVDYNVSADVAADMGLQRTKLFNLTIEDTKTGTREVFLNLTKVDSPRRVDRVLENESSLVRLATGLDSASERPQESKPKYIVEPDGQASDSAPLAVGDYKGSESDKTGIYSLENTALFNLLCIPPDTRTSDTSPDVWKEAMAYCERRRAMLIVDAPKTWKDANDITKNNNVKLTDLGLTGRPARNAAIYYPRVHQADDKRNGQLDTFAPCGIIAGLMARTDADRGVWKAPAGIDAALNGVQGLNVNLSDAENGQLNQLGINCLRSFPDSGRVIWGARTLRGADVIADEYKYIPVRRTALYIEESLFRGLKWVVFEPNDEPLWAQIRLNVGAFMNNLFRQSAFQGMTPRDAYFVKCDKETTTQNDINLGIVNVHVGFAPLKPAEFVIVKLQQIAGQIQT